MFNRAVCRLSPRLCSATLPSTLQRLRHVQTSKFLLRRQASTAAPSRSPKSLPSVAFKSQHAQQAELNRRLAEQGGVRQIFKGPRDTAYFTGIYALSVFSIGYAMVLAHDYVFGSLPGIPAWARYTFAIPVLFLAGFGNWVFLKSVNIIRLIEVLPSNQGLQVRVHIKPNLPLPFRRNRILNVRPGDITLGREMVAPASAGPEVDASLIGRMRAVMYDVFAGSRKIFTSEGFVKTRIEGYGGSYKLNTLGTFETDRRLLNMVLQFDA